MFRKMRPEEELFEKISLRPFPRLFNNAGLNEKKTLINYSEGRLGVITSLKQTTQRHEMQKKL